MRPTHAILHWVQQLCVLVRISNSKQAKSVNLFITLLLLNVVKKLPVSGPAHEEKTLHCTFQSQYNVGVSISRTKCHQVPPRCGKPKDGPSTTDRVLRGQDTKTRPTAARITSELIYTRPTCADFRARSRTLNSLSTRNVPTCRRLGQNQHQQRSRCALFRTTAPIEGGRTHTSKGTAGRAVVVMRLGGCWSLYAGDVFCSRQWLPIVRRLRGLRIWLFQRNERYFCFAEGICKLGLREIVYC